MNRGQAADKILRSTLTGPEKLILLGYLSHIPSASGVSGVAWPGIATLASYASLKETATRAARTRAIASGSLVVVDAVNGRPMKCRLDLDALVARPPRILTPSDSAPPQIPEGTPSDSAGVPPQIPEGTPSDSEGEPSEGTLPSKPSEGTLPIFGASGDAAPPATPPEPDHLDRIWHELETIRVDAAKATGTKASRTKLGGRRNTLRIRVGEHGEGQLIGTVRWWWHSTSDRAQYLRDNGYGWKTVLRPDNLREYVGFATEGGYIDESGAPVWPGRAPTTDGDNGTTKTPDERMHNGKAKVPNPEAGAIWVEQNWPTLAASWTRHVDGVGKLKAGTAFWSEVAAMVDQPANVYYPFMEKFEQRSAS